MPIEFVYFDLGNVLVTFDPHVACQNIAERLNVSVDDAHHAIYATGLQDQFEHGNIDGKQYVDELCAHLDVQRQPSSAFEQKILDAISDMFQPVNNMRTVLDGVRQAGFGVGLLSNTCHAHWDWIRRQHYPATEFSFDAVILSYEVGSMKPDAEIYVAAEQAAKVNADRILFLDDREANVQGARHRGWRSEQCVGGPAVLETLGRAGVLEDS